MIIGHAHFGLFGAIALYFVCAGLYLVKKTGASFLLLVIGFLIHTVYQISRGWLSGVFIAVPMTEGVFLLPWALALIMIVTHMKSSRRDVWQTLIFPLAFFSLFALVHPKGIETLGPTKLTVWAPLYFFFDVTGRACFYCGGWFALLYFLKKADVDSFHTPLVWGFVLFTIAQITGAIWCWLGWAATFQWVYVHFQAATIWCFFANYVHLRFLPKWDAGRKAAYALAGSALMLLITLIGFYRFWTVARVGG